jgi:hypothetical protein
MCTHFASAINEAETTMPVVLQQPRKILFFKEPSPVGLERWELTVGGFFKERLVYEVLCVPRRLTSGGRPIELGKVWLRALVPFSAPHRGAHGADRRGCLDTTRDIVYQWLKCTLAVSCLPEAPRLHQRDQVPVGRRTSFRRLPA